MQRDEDTIVVFTARSPERVIREGGSQAWVLNVNRARDCTWVLCTQNRHNPDHDFSDATEPHGAGFLVGRIAAIQRAQGEGEEERWMIAISEFARVDLPNAWDGSRNPVRYASLKSLGINPAKLKFQAIAVSGEPAKRAAEPAWPFESPPSGLTIPEAKKALAMTFGVKPEAVEITIRG